MSVEVGQPELLARALSRTSMYSSLAMYLLVNCIRGIATASMEAHRLVLDYALLKTLRLTTIS